MSKKALIKLITKPKAPKRRKTKLQTELYEGMSLQTLLENFSEEKDLNLVQYEEIGYRDYRDGGGGYHESYFSVLRPESDEEHQKQVERYKVLLGRYEQWYKENEETILAEIARRTQNAEDRVLRVAEAEEKRLKKELKKVERFLRK